MSTKTPPTQKHHASTTDHPTTAVDDLLVIHLDEDEGICNVVNFEHSEPKEHTYSVTPTDGCSCPASTYNDGPCKHEEAVAVAMLESERPTDDSDDTPRPADKRISGPHAGVDKYGHVDHHYWRCEDCGVEATRREAVAERCWC
jgi:hypothetical protein